MSAPTRAFDVKMPRTFATVANAIKAVEKTTFEPGLTYVIAVDAQGRYFPCFVGESAAHVIHQGFAVISRR